MYSCVSLILEIGSMAYDTSAVLDIEHLARSLLNFIGLSLFTTKFHYFFHRCITNRLPRCVHKIGLGIECLYKSWMTLMKEMCSYL